MGLFVFGKKQQRITYIASGIGLMVFPYFITNVILMSLIGVALTVAPFLIP